MRIQWILAAALAVFAFTGSAQAGDVWRVVDTVGTVRVGGPGFIPVALTRNQVLSSDAWIETGSGRAVLVRNQETIVVEPNSRIQLPGKPVDGNTQVLQTLGSAVYKIGKQMKPHFQVDTPYMAAVVKGTAFTVTVDDGQASVAVTEGLVEVSTPGQEDVEFVRPGFTALVSRENGGEITLDRSRNDVLPQSDAPMKEPQDSKSFVIPAAIGDVDIDIDEVSGGLVTSDVIRVDLPQGKDVVAALPIKDMPTLVPTPIDIVPTPIVPVVDDVVGNVVDVLAPVVDPIIPNNPGNGNDGPNGIGLGLTDSVQGTMDAIRELGNGGLGLGRLLNPH